jgi:NADH dehydrogenase
MHVLKLLAVGAGAGASCGALTGVWTGHWPVLWVSPVIGMVLALGRASRRNLLDSVSTGAALGAAALLAGGGPAAMVGRFAAGMVCGALTGLLLPLTLDDAVALPDDPAPGAPPTRVVILGGGFAGLYTAAYLEGLFGADRSVDFTLISETNAAVFTPMLAEVAGSSLEPSDISTPLRTSLRRTRVHKGRVVEIDVAASRVQVAPVAVAGDQAPLQVGYDHLVIALGGVTRPPSSRDGRGAGVAVQALDFKSLEDALVIRNRVIEMFEAAEREGDPSVRRELLTFVVAGGGFAGVELAGSLNDFARSMLVDHPHLDVTDVKVVLVHGGNRILPELSAPLASYALERMTHRGVAFKLETRVTEATPRTVTLDPPDVIPARTLVWTAGTGPNPLPRACGLPVNAKGAVLVEPTLAVTGMAGVWALGDVAAVVDGETGQACPPTAQFAIREADRLALNIKASVSGEPLRAFHFDSLGSLCVVGHQVACAEVAVPFMPGRKLRFAGLLAWLMWRAIYLAKLPGLERRLRVLIHWTAELFFPRDVVQTVQIRRN